MFNFIRAKYILLFIIICYFLPLSKVRSVYFTALFNLHRKYSLLLPQPKSRLAICNSLQQEIKSIISRDSSKWSVTQITSKGDILLNINSELSRILASNTKLITTAYTLDKLGPHLRLSTNLYVDKDGVFHITGNGDPDFNSKHFLTFAKIISKTHSDLRISSPIKIILYEEPKTTWWPRNWSLEDREESYGAPITRLAITSNATQYSIQNPPAHFIQMLLKELFPLKANIILTTQNSFSILTNQKRLLKSFKSAPLYAFLNLANSESHNFTSEVLVRQAGNSWSTEDLNKKIHSWLGQLGLSNKGVNVVDGSGLSRENKASTYFMASLLRRMDSHRHSNYFLSSLSILGVRGTLRDVPPKSNLYNKFFGKTGTLKGVRSLTGILDSSNNRSYISIISNEILDSDKTMYLILDTISSHQGCN